MEKQFAEIETFTTDMGNGASFCTNCNVRIDISEYHNGYCCPNCNFELVFGKIHTYDFGGSDF